MDNILPAEDKSAQVAWLAVFRNLSFFGFALIVVGVFLPFAQFPLNGARSWFAGGVGFPVVIACIVGVVTILRKVYYPAFCISIFISFFFFLETLITYDMESIRLGTSTTPTAPLRYLFEIFTNAISLGHGALPVFLGVWAVFIGSLFSLLLTNVIVPANQLQEEVDPT